MVFFNKNFSSLNTKVWDENFVSQHPSTASVPDKEDMHWQAYIVQRRGGGINATEHVLWLTFALVPVSHTCSCLSDWNTRICRVASHGSNSQIITHSLIVILSLVDHNSWKVGQSKYM